MTKKIDKKFGSKSSSQDWQCPCPICSGQDDLPQRSDDYAQKINKSKVKKLCPQKNK